MNDVKPKLDNKGAPSTAEMGDGLSRVIVNDAIIPTAAIPTVGPSGDGADARTPETAKPTGACNYVPMPDNTGPRTNGGTSLGAAYGK